MARGLSATPTAEGRPNTSTARHRQALEEAARRPVLLLNAASGPQLSAFPSRGAAKASRPPPEA